MAASAKSRKKKAADALPLDDRKVAESRFLTKDFIPSLLNEVCGVWNQDFKKDLKHFPLNERRWRILALLQRSPSQSLNELVAATGIDQSTLSRIIDQLEKGKLVARSQRRSDARYLEISLTAKGQQIFASVWPIASMHYRRGISALTHKEEEQLRVLLKKLLRKLRPGAQKSG